MCKQMYNDLCKICQVADSFMKCECDFSEVILDDITGNVVDCDKFKAKEKLKIKCTYQCGNKIAVVEKEVYNLPDLPWEEKKPRKKAERFKKPTVEEINAYCAEKGYTNVDTETFINYYDAVGWKVGKTLKPMKSWKGAVANWNKNEPQQEAETEPEIEICYENREALKRIYPDIDWDEYEEEDYILRHTPFYSGKGVVMLSEIQENILLDKIADYRMFNYYLEALADFIIEKDAKPKSHYQTILNWYNQARRI